MDLHMPKLNGLEATSKIHSTKDLEKVPILALRADAFIHHIDDCLKAGMQDYLTKPISFETFCEVLNQYIAKR